MRWPTACARSASNGATGWRCCCRSASRRSIAHVAIYKLGAIAVPLALLFGVEALEYRLQTAGVKAVITNAAGHAKLADIAAGCRRWSTSSRSTGAAGGAVDFQQLVADDPPHFDVESTRSRTIRR